MVFTARTRTAVRHVGHLAERGLDRVRSMTRQQRLEWQLDRHYSALGRVMYPLLHTDVVHTDHPGALERMAAIAVLTEELVALRPAPIADATARAALDDDEERWADEGGQHIA